MFHNQSRIVAEPQGEVVLFPPARQSREIEDLARRLGYSASHCSALVRRATGESFTQLRRRSMVERALGLLRRGSSVKEAALGAGAAAGGER